MLADQGRTDAVHVDSAGTIGFHAGRPPDPRMCAEAVKRGYILTSRARQVTPEDLRKFDRVITMDRENYSNVMRLVPGKAPHVRMLSEYLDDSWPRDVPDPYYGGPEGFTFVLDMLEAACPKIISELLDSPVHQ